jgi:hypothetical protein
MIFGFTTVMGPVMVVCPPVVVDTVVVDVVEEPLVVFWLEPKLVVDPPMPDVPITQYMPFHTVPLLHC